MKLETIEKLWVSDEIDEKASVAHWDTMADNFNTLEMPTEKTSGFMRLLRQEGILESCETALDVGCGAGKYAIALSDAFKKITGIDLSPKMIAFAKENAEKLGKENLDFQCMSWQSLEVEKGPMEKAYDLVFAHMTPAIKSAETFEKMMQASKNWCVLTKGIRWKSPVSEHIDHLLGLAPAHKDEDLLYAVEILWLKGLNPRIAYEDQQWEKVQPLETAYQIAINRAKARRRITAQEEKALRDYLVSISVDDMIHEATHTTVATLYWQVESN